MVDGTLVPIVLALLDGFCSSLKAQGVDPFFSIMSAMSLFCLMEFYQ